MSAEDNARREIIVVCRLLHQKNLIAATDGNVSVRLDYRLLLTPSGVHKGVMREDQLILVDLEGRLLQGAGRPTSEIRLHLTAYEVRPEVRAVVHAHPPLAIACSLAGLSLEEPVLPEVVLTLDGIPTVPYATPTTPEVPAAVREPLKSFDALILTRHGAVTLGRTLWEAYNKMEKVEHAAQIIWAAHLAGGAPRLSQAQVDKLKQLRGQL